jgi:septation ring formation regulator EzrA
MDGATIAMFVFQTVITAIIGVAAWGVKNAIGEMKAAVSELKAADKKNAEEIAAVRTELGELKAALPLVYTTREDFIRVSNNIDSKLDKLLYRMQAKEG